MNLLTVLLAVAAVAYVLVRRFAGEPLEGRRLVVLPLVLTIVGATRLDHLHASTLDIAVLVVEAVLALALGAARGLTVQVFTRGGHLWYRYRPLTVVVWLVSILLRLAQTAAGHALGADTLLERDRTREAAAAVDRAGRLTRDGLAETRRAVAALRGDPLPLPELVAALAEDAGLEVAGDPRPLPAESGLALYRSCQEALTNARRHAPGAAVRIRLAYLPGTVELSVTNDRPPGPPPTTPLPAGYGLTGLRERAELAGGTFAAGPHGDGWRVDVKIPG